MKPYSIKKIRKSIYQITEPFFKEGANMYLFVGKKHQLLIDAGIGVSDIYSFLAEQGFSNVYTVITHAHFDHCGGLTFAQSKKVFVTRLQQQALKNKKLWGLQYLHEGDFTSAMDNRGISALCRKIRKAHHFDYRVGIPSSILRTEAFDLEVVNAPGHSADSVLFYEKKQRLLISGDSLYDGKMYVDFPNADKKAFLRTLGKISRFGIKMVLPGHNNRLNEEGLKRVIKSWLTVLR